MTTKHVTANDFLEWCEEVKLPEFEEAAAGGDIVAAEKAETLRGILAKAHASSPAPTSYGNARRPTLAEFDKPGETWGNA
jgi:hypothetical protein